MPFSPRPTTWSDAADGSVFDRCSLLSLWTRRSPSAHQNRCRVTKHENHLLPRRRRVDGFALGKSPCRADADDAVSREFSRKPAGLEPRMTADIDCPDEDDERHGFRMASAIRPGNQAADVATACDPTQRMDRIIAR